VLLVDDVPRLRSLVKSLLGLAGMDVVGEAGDGHTAERLALELDPGIVVVDSSIPGGGSVVVARLKSVLPELAIVGYSADASEVTRREMLAAGAGAYVVKGGPISELIDAISFVWRINHDDSA